LSLQVVGHELGERVNGRGELLEVHLLQGDADKGAELTQAATLGIPWIGTCIPRKSYFWGVKLIIDMFEKLAPRLFKLVWKKASAFTLFCKKTPPPLTNQPTSQIFKNVNSQPIQKNMI
jgi:hypothetical protein